MSKLKGPQGNDKEAAERLVNKLNDLYSDEKMAATYEEQAAVTPEDKIKVKASLWGLERFQVAESELFSHQGKYHVYFDLDAGIAKLEEIEP